MTPGVIWKFDNMLLMTPWNDVIAKIQMRKHIAEQRRLGLQSVRDMVNVKRAQLGLPLDHS